MNDFLLSQITLITADLLTLLPLVLGLYVLALNPRERANQVTGIYVLLLAFINMAMAAVLRNVNALLTHFALQVFVGLAPLAGPASLLMALFLLQPERLPELRNPLRSRESVQRRILWLLWGLPPLLVVIDAVLGTHLLFTPPAPPIVKPTLALAEAGKGALGDLITLLYTILPPASLLIVIPVLIKRGQIPAARRSIGWILFALTGMAILLESLPTVPGSRYYVILFVDTLYAVVYTIAAYRQIFSERLTAARIKLQPRLTLLIVVVVLPALALVGITANGLVYTLATRSADARLNDIGTLVGNDIQQWLEFNAEVLQAMAAQPEIISMDPSLQEPILRNMDASHGYMYLVSTTDVLGRNVARSDGKQAKDYSDRLWFQRALRGEPLVTQVLIGRTSHQPALVVSTPIRNEAGNIVGVLMFASTLNDLSNAVLQARLGETGFAYLVDEQNLLLAHPQMFQTPIDKLEDFSQEPPIQALRSQTNGSTLLSTYEDENGIHWRAYAAVLPNGWAVVMQQQEQEFLIPPRTFATLLIGLLGLISILLTTLVWASIRQIAAPVEYLTETVEAISEGDLERRIDLPGEDEIATLGRAFSHMTNRLRSAIQELEKRVAERTSGLERRTTHLQAIIEIGQAVSTTRNLDDLLNQAAQSVSEKFGFYHTGIFLLDESGQYAVLQAANSPGGKRMLANGHRLLVGRQGVVGYTAFTRQPRVALNVGEDAVHFNNPNLPDTQSEAALPLVAGGELLGVLDVQSTETNAFSEDDIETLQALADQIAIAIQNARLVEETQRLLEAQREAAGLWTRRIWKRQVEALTHPAVKRTPEGLRLLSEIPSPPPAEQHDRGPEESPKKVFLDPEDPRLLHVPLVRGEVVIGYLQARKPSDAPPWSADETAFMQTLSDELGPALDSARLYQETQINAWQQRVALNIASQMRQNLELETILRTTVTQIRQALDLSEVHIQLSGNRETTA